MPTGDLAGNIESLKRALTHVKYPTSDFDTAGATLGDPTSSLPVLNYLLVGFSGQLARDFADRGYELQGKSDLRFVEAAYKLLREVFSYRPPLTVQQFLTQGFAERKVLLLHDVVQLCSRHHNDLVRQARLASVKPKAGGPSFLANPLAANRTSGSAATAGQEASLGPSTRQGRPGTGKDPAPAPAKRAPSAGSRAAAGAAATGSGRGLASTAASGGAPGSSSSGAVSYEVVRGGILAQRASVSGHVASSSDMVGQRPGESSFHFDAARWVGASGGAAPGGQGDDEEMFGGAESPRPRSGYGGAGGAGVAGSAHVYRIGSEAPEEDEGDYDEDGEYEDGASPRYGGRPAAHWRADISPQLSYFDTSLGGATMGLTLPPRKNSSRGGMAAVSLGQPGQAGPQAATFFLDSGMLDPEAMEGGGSRPGTAGGFFAGPGTRGHHIHHAPHHHGHGHGHGQPPLYPSAPTSASGYGTSAPPSAYGSGAAALQPLPLPPATHRTPTHASLSPSPPPPAAPHAQGGSGPVHQAALEAQVAALSRQVAALTERLQHVESSGARQSDILQARITVLEGRVKFLEGRQPGAVAFTAGAGASGASSSSASTALVPAAPQAKAGSGDGGAGRAIVSYSAAGGAAALAERPSMAPPGAGTSNGAGQGQPQPGSSSLQGFIADVSRRLAATQELLLRSSG